MVNKCYSLNNAWLWKQTNSKKQTDKTTTTTKEVEKNSILKRMIPDSPDPLNKGSTKAPHVCTDSNLATRAGKKLSSPEMALGKYLGVEMGF